MRNIAASKPATWSCESETISASDPSIKLCTLNCRFCHTGTQRLVRNLTPAEIVGQVMVARDALGDWPSTGENRRLTNVVMMGMGEPLYNFDNVKTALAIVADGDGLALSKRRITLSTAGVAPMIRRAG